MIRQEDYDPSRHAFIGIEEPGKVLGSGDVLRFSLTFMGRSTRAGVVVAAAAVHGLEAVQVLLPKEHGRIAPPYPEHAAKFGILCCAQPQDFEGTPIEEEPVFDIRGAVEKGLQAARGIWEPYTKSGGLSMNETAAGTGTIILPPPGHPPDQLWFPDVEAS